MSSANGYSGLDEIRRADAYPLALRAARLYLGGIVWAMASALIVNFANLSVWFFLVSAIAIPFIWAGVLTARKAFSRLGQDVTHLPQREIRSAATIAAFQDLLTRQR
jgi:hypothetical protein